MSGLKADQDVKTVVPMREIVQRDFTAVSVYLLFFVLLVFTISQKCYYHPNEHCMHIIANKYAEAIPTPSGDAAYIFKGPSANANTMVTTLSVESGHSFDFANAWHNMVNDCHPPLYTLLLHFVCSFFPGVFSKWFAGSLNICFMLLILFVVRKFVRVFTDNKFILTVVSLVVACSSALCNAAAFFRMYTAAMFWITLNTYLFVRQAGKSVTNKFCSLIFAVTLFSSMTHYYCAFYAILLSAVYAVQLLIDREYKGLLKFCGTQLFAAVTMLSIYPSAIKHLFHSSRAVESLSNAGSATDYSTRLLRCWKIMNNELFGGMLIVCIVLAVGLCIYGYKFKPEKKTDLQGENASNPETKRYWFVLIPVICYFLVVAKTAHIQVVDFFQEGFSRYFHPIFAVSLVGVLTYVFTKLSGIMKPKFSKIAITILSVLIICGSFGCTNWDMDFVYRGFIQNQPIRDAYADADCICFTAIGINFCEECEFAGYKSLTWLPLNFDYTKLDNVNFGSKLVICIQNPGYSTDETMNRILPHLRGFNVTYRVPMFLEWGTKGTLYYLDRIGI